MYGVTKHPILTVPERESVSFLFEGRSVEGRKGFTIAAALHQAGFPVHSHSLDKRKRSLECGIGKCGACEMLVDGQIRRICVTPVDGVREVREIPEDFQPQAIPLSANAPAKVYQTRVAIIGAGPAGLAARELLNQHKIPNLVVDGNASIGGQFLMQTHQFFFFEKEQRFGGRRGFEIAGTLAGDNSSGILLNSVVWDVLEGRRLAVKNIVSNEIFYIDADYLVVAAGAVPFMPPFENDDLPGVYTAAVVQKMMNQEFTLLGKNVLTVGAGNIGYLTSYQLAQAGANVKAIIEAMPHEGGFPVQANRVRRLGIPVLTSHILLKAVPNAAKDGITGAVVAECKHFKPIPGTERVIEGIDAINICTGLVPDDQLLTKGQQVFGLNCFGAGDAVRIGEGTTAVLRGRQAAYEILAAMGVRFPYNDYLQLSKEFIDSQQHPVRVLEKAVEPTGERRRKPFVVTDCLYGFACNPCAFACPHGAITKSSTSTVPAVDFAKCVGCMLCVTKCPGLAIFGYDLEKRHVFLPVEFETAEGGEADLVDNRGRVLGRGRIEKVVRKAAMPHLVRIAAPELVPEELTAVRGFIPPERRPEPPAFGQHGECAAEAYICHCEDVKLQEILDVVGSRKFISVDEVKHTTRLGMGACRGKRCFRRLKQLLHPLGIALVGEVTPRAPLSSQVRLGETYPAGGRGEIITHAPGAKRRVVHADCLIGGGGIAGSSLFRYFAEAGMKPVLVNFERGSSWRNIAAGRPSFSVPELSDIAMRNHVLFQELHALKPVDYRRTVYVTFAHDQAMLKALDASRAWSDAYMVEPKEFQKEISDRLNPNLDKYLAALVTRDCWQATPGKVIDLLRTIGIRHGGTILEDSRVLDVSKEGDLYRVLVRCHETFEVVEYRTPVFVNALGAEAGKFAAKLGIETGFYPVRHQAFITRRLPPMGVNGEPLPMLIDRRPYAGFTAVYGQQLAETGQIIACASPLTDGAEAGKDLKVNTQEFLEVASEVFVDWLPDLSSVGFQAVWSGYYVEPRIIIDPKLGLFGGLRGQGFMLSQFLAKLYVDALTGKEIPAYFSRLALTGDGLAEKTFK